VFFDLYAPKPPMPPSALTPPQPTLGDVPQPRGLFQEVLGSDLGALYRDMTAHPEKYSEDVVAMVADLLAANRPPLPEERQKLDLAVYDFNKPDRPPTTPKKAGPVARQIAPSAPTPPSRPEPVTPPSSDAVGKDGDIPQAFWWLRNK